MAILALEVLDGQIGMLRPEPHGLGQPVHPATQQEHHGLLGHGCGGDGGHQCERLGLDRERC